MQKVTPMEPGSQGNKVRNLHEVLHLFLRTREKNTRNLCEVLRFFRQRNILEIDEQERETLERHLQRELEEQVYGEVTTRLVKIFQEQHDLDAKGIVDEATAEAINGSIGSDSIDQAILDLRS